MNLSNAFTVQIFFSVNTWKVLFFWTSKFLTFSEVSLAKFVSREFKKVLKHQPTLIFCTFPPPYQYNQLSIAQKKFYWKLNQENNFNLIKLPNLHLSQCSLKQNLIKECLIEFCNVYFVCVWVIFMMSYFLVILSSN